MIYWCLNCWVCGELDTRGRCESCGSGAVVLAESYPLRPEWKYCYEVKGTGSVFEPLYR